MVVDEEEKCEIVGVLEKAEMLMRIVLELFAGRRGAFWWGA